MPKITRYESQVQNAAIPSLTVQPVSAVAEDFKSPVTKIAEGLAPVVNNTASRLIEIEVKKNAQATSNFDYVEASNVAGEAEESIRQISNHTALQ